MQLTKKNILLISPESWDHIFVSKHHYATHLAARGNRVFFLNPPGAEYRVDRTQIEGLHTVYYKGFPKGLRFYPAFFRRLFIRREYNVLEKLCGVKFDIVWSFDNSVFFDFSALPEHVLKISHIVDLNQNFQFARAASTADICFGVIDLITSKLKEYNPDSFLVRHGVARIMNETARVSLPGRNRLKSLYAGNLNMPHINWQLFTRVVNENEDTDFIFIGSNRDMISKAVLEGLMSKNNVYFLPPVSAEVLVNYLASADILIAAYTSEYYRQYASPHKLMEYLASGRPTVASYTEGYDIPGELMYMGKTDPEWIGKFSYVKQNIDRCSSAELIQIRKDFAREYTYSNQIARIENLLAKVVTN